MITQYEYTPLNTKKKQIRLLYVDPTRLFSEGEPLDCNIEHVSLSTIGRPLYYAIYYVWADIRNRRDIFINGQTLSVPESADTALRRLYTRTQECLATLTTQESDMILPTIYPIGQAKRHLSSLRWKLVHKSFERVQRNAKIAIWIDAVCINQSDLEERSQQVTMMRQIYSKATTVLIWLGEDDHTTASALDFIQRTNVQWRDAMDRVEDMSKQLYQRKPHRVIPIINGDALPLPCDWSAVETFFAAKWFTRLWVVQ